MARRPKPWYWKQRRSWFVTIAGQRHNLGTDREAAHMRFHELMRTPRQPRVATDLVVAVVDLFLEWTRHHRAESTYQWYVGMCQSFVDSIPATLQLAEFRPFHLQAWLDNHRDDSPSTTRARITAVKRPFAWAARQGYVDRNPLLHFERPEAVHRDRIITPSEYDDLKSAISDDGFRDLITVAWETGARPSRRRNRPGRPWHRAYTLGRRPRWECIAVRRDN